MSLLNVKESSLVKGGGKKVIVKCPNYKYDLTIITKAIHMHKDGMSFYNAANHLWQCDGVKVTPI